MARCGVEYRNDLLGHIHAFGIDSPPTRYQTGHVIEEGQEDWPPNSDICREFRGAAGTLGYCHPIWGAHPPGMTPKEALAVGQNGARTVEARELVADAILGLVDSVDVLSPADCESSSVLYHRLLGAGVRLAVSAGTDAMLSISHGISSDPPGWARMYCLTGDERLTAVSLQDSIRRGSTFATNGPWIELWANECGPGSTLALGPNEEVVLQATAANHGVRELLIVSADGILGRSLAKGNTAKVSLTVKTTGPTWIAAIAKGEDAPGVTRGRPFAHK